MNDPFSAGQHEPYSDCDELSSGGQLVDSSASGSVSESSILASLERQEETIEVEALREENKVLRAELDAERRKTDLLCSRNEKLTSLKDQLRIELGNETQKRKVLKTEKSRLSKENGFLANRVSELEELVKTISLNVGKPSGTGRSHSVSSKTISQPRGRMQSEEMRRRTVDESPDPEPQTAHQDPSTFVSTPWSREVREKRISKMDAIAVEERDGRKITSTTRCETPPRTYTSTMIPLQLEESERLYNQDDDEIVSNQSPLLLPLSSEPHQGQQETASELPPRTNTTHYGTKQTIHSIISSGGNSGANTPPAREEPSDQLTRRTSGDDAQKALPTADGPHPGKLGNDAMQRVVDDYERVIEELSKELRATRTVLHEVATDRAGLRTDFRRALHKIEQIEREKQQLLFSAETSSRHRSALSARQDLTKAEGVGNGETGFRRTRAISPYQNPKQPQALRGDLSQSTLESASQGDSSSRGAAMKTNHRNASSSTDFKQLSSRSNVSTASSQKTRPATVSTNSSSLLARNARLTVGSSNPRNSSSTRAPSLLGQ